MEAITYCENPGCPLSGAPVKLYGNPEWWSKRVILCEDFIEVISKTGRKGTFSWGHRMYQSRGLVRVQEFRRGDMALTEDGEEEVISVQPIHIPDASVDCYHATKGHVYSAWGFIGHNIKTT